MKNELMIGNYVSVTPHGKHDIMQLKEKDLENLIIFNTWDRIKPIPLTEEWLTKFGFIYRSLIFGYLKFEIEENILYLNEVGLKIKYIHELQNLYFSLTKEKLDFKKK